MKVRHELTDAERRTVRDRLRRRLMERPELCFAYVHGGVVATPHFGDVDVAVSVDPAQLARVDSTTYELELEAELERDVRLPVDVRVVDHAPVTFRYAVTRGKELFVRDREAWAAFRERTWNEYLDFAPLREEVFRDLARGARHRWGR
jgi:predicted nucleotidyltransferase